MKIAIICGALEPGKDGVGDYTRRLAGEMIKSGHQVIAIAINDRYISKNIQYTQDADGVELAVMRITSVADSTQRYALLRNFLVEFNADWLSLQFVPYSYHLKGVPFSLFSRLSSLRLKAKWHILFHEIWLDKPESFSQYIVKTLQKAAIVLGTKRLKPNVVHTTIAYNQHRLQRMGIKSLLLNLFGNIAYSTSQQTLPGWVGSVKNILYFGGPPRNEYSEQVINGLEQFCKSLGQPFNLILVSGHSALKDEFVSILGKRLLTYGVQIKDMGFVETVALSNLLSNCSAGIVRSEPYFLGKSGSAIAMLEHGLPIWLPKWNGTEKVDYDFRHHLIFSDLHQATKQTHETFYSLLPQTAQQFITQLSNN